MSGERPVPLVVLSSAREPVEAINGILRRAGHPVHCTWIPSLRDLGDALSQLNPELLLKADGEESLADTVAVRDQCAPTVPLIVIADHVDESRIAAALAQGARDVVSLGSPERLQAVMSRELHSFRLERALANTLRSASDARRQLETVLQRSNDAIVQVQEGIVTEANPSWLELLGYEDGSVLAGQPIMDLFAESSHAAIKGALTACMQGRWNNHTLAVSAKLASGTTLDIEVVLALGEIDGEPCVRLVVPARERDGTALEENLQQAVTHDPSTGLLYRRPLLEQLTARLAVPATAGVRHIAVIKPDKFGAIDREVGVMASEDCLIEFANLIKSHLNPNDLAGRLGGVTFLALLERGNENDASAWSEQLVAKAAKHVVRVKDKSFSISCTIGLSVVASTNPNIDSTIADALEVCRKAAERGGNQVGVSEQADADARVKSYDSVWVKHIKSALMENRFRLVQQPVASLQGEDSGMFDVLVRMIDAQGKEVLPAEFMAAAERNDLLKNIDRWVVGASLSFAAQRKPGCLFVRLSRDTIKDPSFLGWLDNQTRASRAEPTRVCFQTAENVAATHVAQAKALGTMLRQRGFKFALDNFGAGRDPQGLLETVPLDFVKIDGALVQSLTKDEEIQNKVRTLVQSAHGRQVQTIAERVEDANTMAVLWQLGVEYIQGYFVNAPEEVVLSAAR